jgi:hypothetical protein
MVQTAKQSKKDAMESPGHPSRDDSSGGESDDLEDIEMDIDGEETEHEDVPSASIAGPSKSKPHPVLTKKRDSKCEGKGGR